MHDAVDDGSTTSAPCGSRQGRTRTSSTSTADAPSTAGGPARRGSCGAEPAWSGPEGERRTTSAGRPAGLRLTTQWPVGPRRSDRRRPARGGCPLGSPPGAGAEPHRQGGGRSPTRRGRWDDGQGKAPRTLTPRGLPRARARVSHSVAHMSTGRRPPNGRPRHPVERYVRFFPQKLSPPCARSHDPGGDRRRTLWTPCARRGGRRSARVAGRQAGASTGCRSTETSGRAPEPSVKITPRSGGTSP